MGVFAIVGPSGAGKDTLMEGLITRHPHIHRARRTITRSNDGTEDQESVTQDAFDALLAEGAFALHWQAHGLSYGIRHSELAHETVIFNGSRQALAQAAERLPDLRVILIEVSPEVLADRLASRGRETTEDIAKRLERAKQALPEGIAYLVVRNDGTQAEGIDALCAAVQPVSV
ncbi:AAA family ATPase [Donghicola sp. C2-DW-16]|uniref:AAA family ATPase n=1 Tax=Donghicola mangrovi TaxID=2729614 RepID=A0ABX2PDJ1_9RHOB|nr:AAA family ATPase [Donghicola mangrovi]NVO27260.1 AAA family ATPase [Donghicola mangrovi]